MKLIKYSLAISILLLFFYGCKKEKHPAASIAPPTIYDTLIVLKNQAPPTRLSFAPGIYIDITFNGDISENRCPNCLTKGSAQCPYMGWAETSFTVKIQNGDSMILPVSFYSCIAENDTIVGTNNQATEFGPWNTYHIWPMALNPYPTDSGYKPYTLTVLVQYPY